MSVTIKEIMNLPAMKEASILTNFKCYDKTISSITVFDSSDDEKIRENKNITLKSYDSELVITSFANCSNDIEKQKSLVKMLKLTGETGIIVYYVGYIMPYIDKSLIELANELEFVIIMMPEGRRELRYSDLIHEVMELIVKDKSIDIYFAGDVINRASRLPRKRQNIDSVLEILRDTVHCSIFIVDDFGKILNGAEWPVDRGIPIKKIIEVLFASDCKDGVIKDIFIEKESFIAVKELLKNNGGEIMYAIIVKESHGLDSHIKTQICDVIMTFINLWSEDNTKMGKKQLISSIIKDERYKTERICQMLNINIREFDTMIIFSSIVPMDNRGLIERSELLINRIMEICDMMRTKVLIDRFEGKLIMFLKFNRELISEIYKNIEDMICIFSNLDLTHDTSEVNFAYNTYVEHLCDAETIFKGKRPLWANDINIAKKCSDIVKRGDREIQKAIKPVRKLVLHKNKDLLNTVSVYLLEGEMNIQKTANIMYLHSNTIKYRIKQVEEILSISLSNISDINMIYEALALIRIAK